MLHTKYTWPFWFTINIVFSEQPATVKTLCLSSHACLTFVRVSKDICIVLLLVWLHCDSNLHVHCFIFIWSDLVILHFSVKVVQVYFAITFECVCLNVEYDECSFHAESLKIRLNMNVAQKVHMTILI